MEKKWSTSTVMSVSTSTITGMSQRRDVFRYNGKWGIFDTKLLQLVKVFLTFDGSKFTIALRVDPGFVHWRINHTHNLSCIWPEFLGEISEMLSQHQTSALQVVTTLHQDIFHPAIGKSYDDNFFDDVLRVRSGWSSSIWQGRIGSGSEGNSAFISSTIA